jgi:N-succinyldiaminopimelate aminotransferase
VVFHSLSKRSNLPGLRSGFIAGDQQLLQNFLKFRTYHGCAMSLPTQEASIAAWSDESHVVENRSLYRKKFAAVGDILSGKLAFTQPSASFYLWPKTPIDDALFAQGLYAQQNVTLLPGQYLSRPTATGNPGQNRVRMALVADINECVEAAKRIVQFVDSLKL